MQVMPSHDFYIIDRIIIHTTTSECAFFSSAHGIFTKIDHFWNDKNVPIQILDD